MNAPTLDHVALADIPGSTSASEWRRVAPPLGLGVVLLGALFNKEVVAAIQTWDASTAYNHCYLIIPIALTDLFVTVYQNVCFRTYRVPLVKRSEYVVRDRKYLEYLNAIQKLNCMYCEYSNGVIAYAREVASRTEQFWCPIKHARKLKDAHDRYYDFIEYGDSEDLPTKMEDQREKCRACEVPCGK